MELPLGEARVFPRKKKTFHTPPPTAPDTPADTHRPSPRPTETVRHPLPFRGTRWVLLQGAKERHLLSLHSEERV
jgi:hypothetical protein